MIMINGAFDKEFISINYESYVEFKSIINLEEEHYKDLKTGFYFSIKNQFENVK